MTLALVKNKTKKTIQLDIGLPVGRYLWVGNHDGFQMKPSIPKIAIDRNTTLSERKSEWAERIKLC